MSTKSSYKMISKKTGFKDFSFAITRVNYILKYSKLERVITL